MLNDSHFCTLYMAKLRQEELLRITEVERIRQEFLQGQKRKPAVLKFILEGAGKTLVNTGNRLLEIA